MHRVRRFLRLLAAALVLLLAAAAALALATQTPAFKGWLRQLAVRQANRVLNGELSIGRLSGTLFSGITLDRVAVVMDGGEVIRIDSITVKYDVVEMISKGVSLARLEVRRPVVTLVRADETWNLGRLIRRRNRPDNPDGKRRPIALKRIEIIDGSVAIAGQVPSGGFRLPHHFDHIDAAFALAYEADRWTFDLDRVAFQAADPAFRLHELSGAIALDDHQIALRNLAVRTGESSLSIDGTIERGVPQPKIDLAVTSGKLSLPELAPLVPKLANVTLQPSFEVRVAGPTGHLAVDMNVRAETWRVSGALVADLAQPKQSVAGRLRLENFDLITIIHNPDAKTDISGTSTFEVRGEPLSNPDTLRWTVTLDGPHAAALGYEADDVSVRARIAGPRIEFSGQARGYGADATGTGFVVVKGDTRPLTYEVRGSARHVDLRRLPERVHVPPAQSDLNVSYEVRGSSAPGENGRKEVVASGHFTDSTIEGMRVSPGSTGGLTFRDGQFTYEADLTVADLDLQRLGNGFDLGPLRRDRLASALNGHVVTNGSWTTVHDLSLAAQGMLESSTLPGAHIGALGFTASFADDTLRFSAQGHADRVDLKTVFAPLAIAGLVEGAIDVQATMREISRGISLDRLDASGRLDLEKSTIGPLAIDRASIDGDYHPSAASVRALDVTSASMSAHAEGTLALDEEGESHLTFRGETPDLAELGALLHQPLGGSGVVTGTVTGNRRELIAAGHLGTTEVKYADASALVLDADYTVRVPSLRMADLSMSATTQATFVSVAGQNINELQATTSYAHERLDFDAVAREPRRSLGAAGSVIIAADRREVHVQRLAASTDGQAWQLAAGAQPIVRYGDRGVAISDLRLQSGDQIVSAEGAFGRPGDHLAVTLDNIDVAAVEVIMLRPPQFTGRLHASAIISGTRERPEVEAKVQVREGGFQQFRYEDLSGTVTYAGKGVDIDVKLQQNPSAWLTVKGYTPVALINGPGNAPQHTVVAPEDRVALKIESSAIDLGLIEGFTTAVTKVTGTMQANLEIVGTAADPHPGGSIDIRDAAFTVAAAGVKYTGGTGRIEFEGDRVHIGALRVLDNQKKAMSVSGELAFHERDLSGVDIIVKADNFKVLDNKIGNVRINTDLHVVGELRYPRIEGVLGVGSGVIDLDELIESTTNGAYTPAAESARDTGTALDGVPEPPAKPNFFDALQMQVHVTIPNDLVVKGADLRLADSPVGLGALNVTLGGDLWMSKTPWDRIRVTGTVNTVRGTYEFQGRRFDILRDGIARFDGLDEKDPRIDIRAERLIQGVQADVNLRGSLRHPEIMLTSTPPLDQADVLALIVFGQPVNQIAAGQQINLIERARSMALGVVAVQLANSIGSALDLDTFEIQIAPDSGAAAQVTVGQQVGQNLFLKVEQGVGDQSTTNVVVEYQLNKYLLLQSNFRPTSPTLQPFQRVQGTGIDLIYVVSY